MDKFLKFQAKIFFYFPFYFMIVSDLIFNLLFGWLRLLYRSLLKNKKFVKLAFEFQRAAHQDAFLLEYIVHVFTFSCILFAAYPVSYDVFRILNCLVPPMLLRSEWRVTMSR